MLRTRIIQASLRKYSCSCSQSQSQENTGMPQENKDSSQSKFASWRNYVAQTTAVNLRITDNPRYVTFTYPGLNPVCLDHFGNPDISLVNRLLHDVFFCAVKIPTIVDGKPKVLMDFRRLMQKNNVFIAGLQIDMSRTFYNKSIPKWPLDAKVAYGGLGRTTMLSLIEMFLPGAQEPLVSRSLKFVCVDPGTLRPTTFPEWMQEDLIGKEAQGKDIMFRGFPRPECTFMYRMKVANSDTDWYNHTNFTSYMRFALNALYSAINQNARRNTAHGVRSQDGAGKTARTNSGSESMSTSQRPSSVAGDPASVIWLNRDIVRHGIKSMKICYKNESLEGDELDVHVWQEKSETLTFKCSIEKLDGTVCSQCQMEFFGPSPSL